MKKSQSVVSYNAIYGSINDSRISSKSIDRKNIRMLKEAVSVYSISFNRSLNILNI